MQAYINGNPYGGVVVANYTINPSPPVTSGLEFWLAADSITASNGSLVGSWTDKAANITLSQSNSVLQPTFVTNDSNGKPALRFTGNTTLSSSSSVLGISRDMTIVTVAMTTTATPSGEDAILLGFEPNARGLGYKSSKQYFEAGGYVTTGAASPPANVFVGEMATLTAPVSNASNITYYRNGSQTSGPSVVGGITNPNAGITAGLSWHGDIAEVLVYDRLLSPTELQQIGVYLANKYGLYHPQATWPFSYPAAVQTRIFQNQWSKAQADAYVSSYATLVANNPSMLTRGLAVWLKGDAQLAHTGSNVTQWTDQVTGNVLVPTNTSNEPQYVASDLNGVPGVQFTGSSGLKAAVSNLLGFTLNADMTIITVGMTTVPTTEQTSVDLGLTRIAGYKNSLEYFGNQSNVDNFGVAVPSASTFTIEASSLNPDQNAISFYQNGVNSTPTPTFGLSSVGAGIWVGVNSDGTDFGWTGNIDEILIYDHQLSPAEMQQVTAYLEAKYNLDGAYPYPPPTVTPAGGSSTSSFSVSISAAPAGTTIRYTLDGTTPMPTTGMVYSSSFTVTSSLPVNCAIFQGNTQASAINTVQFYVGDSGNIGISDAWQIEYFGHTGIDPNADPLGSGLTYLQKYLLGYNPLDYSTNGDGLSDLVNYELGYAATDTDINGYLNYNGTPMTNAQQLALGLDPFGIGDNPPPSPPPTDPGDTTAPTITLTVPQGATQIQ